MDMSTSINLPQIISCDICIMIYVKKFPFILLFRSYQTDTQTFLFFYLFFIF